VATIGAATGLATVWVKAAPSSRQSPPPDGSVVTGVASFYVAERQPANQFAVDHPRISDGSVAADSFGCSDHFLVVIGTNGVTGLQQDETNLFPGHRAIQR